MSVVAWGYNNMGQSTVPESAKNNVVAVAAGREHSLAMKSDGSVVCWGGEMFTSVPVEAMSGVVQVACGWYHSLALKGDGSVVSWGYRADVPNGLPALKYVTGGELFSVGLDTTGKVHIWGENSFSLPESLNSGVKEIRASKQSIIALKEDGTVVCASQTGCEVPQNAQGNVRSVNVGYGKFFVVKNDNTVVSWNEPFSQSSIDESLLTGVSDVLSGDDFCLLLKTDNTVVLVGENWCGQLDKPTDLETVNKYAVGMHHVLALI